jgi:hypothetical protein
LFLRDVNTLPDHLKRRISRVARSDHEERIAVGRRSHDNFRANISGSTWPILDDERLTETLRQPLTG